MSEEKDKILFADVASRSVNYHGERTCGDMFLTRSLAFGRRRIMVLSDGMGHGVRANVLSTFTSTMLLNFLSTRADMATVARDVTAMLPISNIHSFSYATFTVADVDTRTNEVSVIQYDNPPAFLVRGSKARELDWENIVTAKSGGGELRLRAAKFKAQEGDRLVMSSDGVTQSGQRTGLYRFGWGQGQFVELAEYLVASNPGISSADMASQIVSKARMNDSGKPSDDITCAVLTLRKPRNLMMISCPPSYPALNGELYDKVSEFEGTRIVCGHPVAHILAECAGRRLEKNPDSKHNPRLPQYRLHGYDLVTEGMVVPNRVLDLLEHHQGTIESPDLAGRICRQLCSHDNIEFVLGLHRSSFTAEGMPDEFELRRNIFRSIAQVLKTRHGKEVRMTFI